MQILGLLCVSLYCLASVIVGVRLARLARRTGELLETMIGTALLSGGMIGYPASVASQLLAFGAPDVAFPIAVVGSVGLTVAAVCVLVAWWKIYHPASQWAPWVVSVWTMLLVAVFVVRLRLPVAEMAPGSNPWEPLRSVAQGGAYAAMVWSGVRYYALLRRRMRLGIADPVVANRIWLWNVAASCVTLQYGYFLAMPYIDRFYDAVSMAPAFVGTLGVIIALTLTLAFCPPQAYLRRIERRAEMEVG